MSELELLKIYPTRLEFVETILETVCGRGK